MKSEALKEAYNEAYSVRTGEFEVGRRREFSVDFDDLLEENGNGTYTVP